MSMVEKFALTRAEEEWFTKGQIDRRLKLAQKIDDGQDVWWRRGEFHGYDNKPKWHIISDRELVYVKISDTYTSPHAKYTALCGYSKTFSEMVLGEEPKFKITRPKLDDRCIKCSIEYNRREQLDEEVY